MSIQMLVRTATPATVARMSGDDDAVEAWLDEGFGEGVELGKAWDALGRAVEDGEAPYPFFNGVSEHEIDELVEWLVDVRGSLLACVRTASEAGDHLILVMQ